MAQGKTVAQAVAEKAAAKSAKLNPMGTDAYETAKAGGKNAGLLRRYQSDPDHLVEKAIRSLEKRIIEHQGYIANPYLKVPAGYSQVDIDRLTQRTWPKEIAAYQAEKEVLTGMLEKRKRK